MLRREGRVLLLSESSGEVDDTAAAAAGDADTETVS